MKIRPLQSDFLPIKLDFFKPVESPHAPRRYQLFKEIQDPSGLIRRARKASIHNGVAHSALVLAYRAIVLRRSGEHVSLSRGFVRDIFSTFPWMCRMMQHSGLRPVTQTYQLAADINLRALIRNWILFPQLEKGSHGEALCQNGSFSTVRLR